MCVQLHITNTLNYLNYDGIHSNPSISHVAVNDNPDLFTIPPRN